MKILFMGSPAIAVPTLKTLYESADEITGVVSQPDRPAGRGQIVHPCAVAQFAREKNLTLLQPEKIKTATFYDELKQLAPDLIVVCAYGRILPKSILDLPPKGCINLHFSLLPEYRGAAPVQWALINGEEETGVTTLFMTEELDAGPILFQEEVPIQPEETTETLGQRLSTIGANLLIRTIEKLKRGECIPIPQDEEEATYAPLLKKEDGKIDFSKKAKTLWHRIRGMTPWPGAYMTLNGQRLKIWKASYEEAKTSEPPGTLLSADERGIKIICGKGTLVLEEVQLEGKKRMTAVDFLKGHPPTGRDQVG
ncbi:MAG: methionyl-tRNA formyltransferase [Deltaproteobacteria bacterium]|nr:methionyl-tRNA formyltransferase [Deltaproteobacteria bacterium]